MSQTGKPSQTKVIEGLPLSILFSALADEHVLSAYLNAVGLKAYLFTNNHTPAKGDVPSDYTILNDSGSPLQFPVSFGDWSISNDGTKGTATLSPLNHTFVDPHASIYGIVFLDNTDTEVAFASLFSGAPLSNVAGQAILINVELDAN